MAIEQTVKDEAVSHLNKAKGEIDAAWSALQDSEEPDTNASLTIDELGIQVDKVTTIIANLGEGLMECNVCHLTIEPGKPCYQLRLGSIEDDGVTFLPDEDVGYYHQLCMVGLP